MATKVTKKMMFNAISTVLNGGQSEYSVADMQAFINKEIALLDRKANSKKTKPTKAQEQNAVYKDLIIKVMESEGRPLTATEIMKADVAFADFSNQKMAALLKLLRNENKVSRITEKGKAYFLLGGENEDNTPEESPEEN